LRSTAGDAYSQASSKMNQVVDRGREAYDRARHTTGSMSTGMGSEPGSTDSTGQGSFAGASYQPTGDRT
jgi:hypothetical protein